jgi:hypothetical protein
LAQLEQISARHPAPHADNDGLHELALLFDPRLAE